MLYIVTAVMAGALIASQSSCNGLLFPTLGVIGVGFVSQALNAVTIFLYQLLVKRQLPSFRGLPPYATLGGLTGVFVIGFTGFCVSALGTAVTVCLSVAGQLVMSAVVDHYGLLGAEKLPFMKRRLWGFIIIIQGVFIINFAGSQGGGLLEGGNGGSGGGGATLLAMLLLAMTLGGLTVITRMFSFFACRCIGLLNGSLSNVAVGAAAALALFFVLSGFRLDLPAFARSNAVGYLAGPMGAAACLMNTVAYEKLKIFRATILIMAGQIAMGIAADVMVFHSLPPGKVLGIAVICAGIAIDKRLTRDR